jgi:hypothetical protein
MNLKVKKIKVDEYPPEHFYKGRYEMTWDAIFFDEDEEPKEKIIEYCRKINAAKPKNGCSPQMWVYGTEWNVDRESYSPAIYHVKNAHGECGEKENLEKAVLAHWDDFNKKSEAHMRSLYVPVPPGDINWTGYIQITLAFVKLVTENDENSDVDWKKTTFNASASYPGGENPHGGTFRLRATNPDINFKEHMQSKIITKFKGRILNEFAEESGYENLIQVIEIDEIESKPMYTEAEYAEFQRQANEGPFLGRLNHPEIFGSNPDLYGPITGEQMQRLLGNQDSGPGGECTT